MAKGKSGKDRGGGKGSMSNRSPGGGVYYVGTTGGSPGQDMVQRGQLEDEEEPIVKLHVIVEGKDRFVPCI
jgi:hypothetical protein